MEGRPEPETQDTPETPSTYMAVLGQPAAGEPYQLKVHSAWCAVVYDFDEPDNPIRVLARLERDGNRMMLTRLVIDNPSIDSRVLRRIAPSRIEAFATEVLIRRRVADTEPLGKPLEPTHLPDAWYYPIHHLIVMSIEISAPGSGILEEPRVATVHKLGGWTLHPDLDPAIDAGDRSFDTAMQIMAEKNAEWSARRESSVGKVRPLRRPDGIDPDQFYQKVAWAYREVVGGSHKPAAVLAEESGVPVTTVHRWIAEARRRGHLPKARKGKAG